MSSDVDVAMDAADLFSGADNTSLKAGLGSNFCIRPQNCVLQNDFRPDAAVLSDDCAAAQLRARIDDRAAGYALGPVPRFEEVRFQLSRKIMRCTSRYSSREEMLNHFPSSITTPPIAAPWP